MEEERWAWKRAATIEEPVDEARYEELKPLKKVAVLLEEVHDYSNYDRAYAKFRGWAA